MNGRRVSTWYTGILFGFHVVGLRHLTDPSTYVPTFLGPCWVGTDWYNITAEAYDLKLYISHHPVKPIRPLHQMSIS